VGLGLAGTAAYVGWVNGPAEGLYPSAGGSVFLYIVLAMLGWFVSLPFLGLGLRGALTTDGYVALFDEAWRLAITLAFACLFVQVFWGLLSLFVALFESIHISWPRQVIWTRSFAYPATCVAASFAIGLTEVQPEMFRGLRRLLLTVLRWLTVVAAAIVLLFLGAVIVEGVTVLWDTHFASAGLISITLMLITLYNAVYQDGRDSEKLPRALAWPVRAALIVGPALAALAFWALVLRIRQHGVSEDRLQALVVVTILAGYLTGYALVAAAGTQAPFAVRHVNVVMALVIVATPVTIHSPLIDLKRVATAAQLRRVPVDGDKFDFQYLRFGLGRHGLGQDSRVVLYSIGSMMWATRFWWMLRALGFDRAAILDGGFDKWKAEGRPTESGPAKGYAPTTFSAKLRPGLFVGREAVLGALSTQGTVIVNALGPQFHKGLEPSRYGRPGRIPGSVNVPAASLVNPATKGFTTLADAEAKLSAQGVTKDRKVICYCGGGISATVDLFLLHQLGYDKLTLYDGSMGEWAKDSSLPIETD
jgi:thiosulfate/3-mercaptopyruvate sulfurtransferase